MKPHVNQNFLNRFISSPAQNNNFSYIEASKTRKELFLNDYIDRMSSLKNARLDDQRKDAFTSAINRYYGK